MPLDLKALRARLEKQGLSEEEIKEYLESWELEETSFPEHFIGTITDPRFETGDYGIQFAATIKVEQIFEPPDISIPERGQLGWWSCGDGWVVSNSLGTSISGRKRIRSNSKYGKLIERAEELEIPLWERGKPTEANIWDGIRCEWKREYGEIPERLQREGGPEKFSTLLPTQWLQDTLPEISGVEEPEPVKPRASKVATTVQPKEVVEAPPEAEIPIDHILMTFVDLAVGKTPKEAIRAALRNPEINANDPLCNILTDEEAYRDLLLTFEASGICKVGDDGRIWRLG